MNYHFQESLVEVLKEIKLEIRTMNASLQALSANTRQLPQDFEQLVGKLDQIHEVLQDKALHE